MSTHRKVPHDLKSVGRSRPRFSISFFGEGRKFYDTHLGLLSHFPQHVPVDYWDNKRTGHAYHADHIDPKGPRDVSNLQWMHPTDHGRKSAAEKSKHSCMKAGKVQRRPIAMCDASSGVVLATYGNLRAAVIANPELSLWPGNISHVCRGNCPTAGGYVWNFLPRHDDADLIGEEWTDLRLFPTASEQLLPNNAREIFTSYLVSFPFIKRGCHFFSKTP